MSSKSAFKTQYVKNPYGNKSKRSRGWMITLTALVLVMAAGTWITGYTARAGKSAASTAQAVDSHAAASGEDSH